MLIDDTQKCPKTAAHTTELVTAIGVQSQFAERELELQLLSMAPAVNNSLNLRHFQELVLVFVLTTLFGTYCPKGVGHEGDSRSHAS